MLLIQFELENAAPACIVASTTSPVVKAEVIGSTRCTSIWSVAGVPVPTDTMTPCATVAPGLPANVTLSACSPPFGSKLRSAVMIWSDMTHDASFAAHTDEG